MSDLTMSETLLLGIALMQRFRCKKVAKKPDAHSWSVEQDFISGVQTALEMSGRKLPPIIVQCQQSKRSITTLTVSDFAL